MRTIYRPMAGHPRAMAREDGMTRAGGDGPATQEASLADGTGEGNAPIAGTSASSDPHVLAGTQEDANAASLNADDYPEEIADAAGAMEAVDAGDPTFPDVKAGADAGSGSAIDAGAQGKQV